MIGRIALSFLYVMALCVLGWIGLSYAFLSLPLSNGFATPTATGPFFCRTLKSSGSDDEAMLLTFVVFFVPALFRLFRFNKSPHMAEVALFLICQLLAVLSLFIARLDCAHILYTAFVVPDLWLATLIALLPGAAVLLALLRRQG